MRPPQGQLRGGQAGGLAGTRAIICRLTSVASSSSSRCRSPIQRRPDFNARALTPSKEFIFCARPKCRDLLPAGQLESAGAANWSTGRQFSSARLNSAKLGSVQFSSIRLSSAQFSWG